MSKFLLLLTIPLILVVASCTSFTSAPFEPEVAGYHLTTPIDEEKLIAAIRVSLVHYGWVITEENTGSFIQAQFEKDAGTIRSNIEVQYDKSGYTIRYIDSSGLDYDEKRMLIHKNYNRWIANLNKNIYTAYIL